MSFVSRTTCRLCSGPLVTVLELEPTPPANALLHGGTCIDQVNRYEADGKTERRVPSPPQDGYADDDEPEECYPLTLAQCSACDHVQLREVVDPKLLFSDYAYQSGTSPVFRAHLEKLARQLSATLFPDDLVVEIGSNDGTLLSYFQQPIRRLGIDPGSQAPAAKAKGVSTIVDFFGLETARTVRSSVGRARLILALNCLAHIDDLDDIADGCRDLLADDGQLVMEVAYLPDMLRDGTFDLVYHEHVSFHHLAPLVPFFATRGLCLYDAERIDTQGGSIRCYVSKRDKPQTDRLRGLLGRERELVTPEALDRFKARIATTKTELTELLGAIKAKGHRIAAFGCPAKATTMFHHFGIGRETIDVIYEENLAKVGKFSPGKHIRIAGVDEFRKDPPAYVLLAAWNFSSDVRSRHEWFTDGGGQWILPMPKVEVVG